VICTSPGRTRLFARDGHGSSLLFKVDDRESQWRSRECDSVVSTPTILEVAENRYAVYFRDARGLYLERRLEWDSGEWNYSAAWTYSTTKTPLKIRFQPSALRLPSASNTPSVTIVFLVDNSKQGIYGTWVDEKWHEPWIQLPQKVLISELFPLALSHNDILVFALAEDHQIYVTRPFQGWTQWISLGGPFAQNVYAVMSGPDRVAVFVIGRDRRIYTTTIYGNARSEPWQSLGGCCISASICHLNGIQPQIDVFVLGVDGSCSRIRQRNGLWDRWEVLGGHFQFLSTNRVLNQIHIFGVGCDGRAWKRSLNV
jgi:hypothetical protein